MQGMSGKTCHWFITGLFPDMRCMKNNLQNQKKRRSSGQQPGRRALAALRASRTFCSSIGLHGISFVRASRKSLKAVCLRCPGVQGGWVSPGRTDPSASRPAPPRSAPPPDPSASRPARPRPAPPSRRAPPRPDPPVVYPGFGLDKCLCSEIPGYALHEMVYKNK